MELNNDNGAVCAEWIDGSIGEIDLYDELTVFTDLSPAEQQRRSAERQRLSEVENPAAEPESQNISDQSLSSEPVLGSEPVEPAEREEPVAAAESSVNTSTTPTEALTEPEWPRPSGPLGSVTHGFVFTGALSGGVCIACGEESGADDLFCIACGEFIE